jgi:hypothetical protein
MQARFRTVSPARSTAVIPVERSALLKIALSKSREIQRLGVIKNRCSSSFGSLLWFWTVFGRDKVAVAVAGGRHLGGFACDEGYPG